MAAIAVPTYTEIGDDTTTCTTATSEILYKHALYTKRMMAGYLFQPATELNIRTIENNCKQELGKLINSYYSKAITSNHESLYLAGTTATTTTSDYIVAQPSSSITNTIFDCKVKYDNSTNSLNFETYCTPNDITSTYGGYLDMNRVETAQRYNYQMCISAEGIYWPSKRDKIKSQMQDKLTIIVKSRGENVKATTENEQIALETLRETIAESEFRKYLKYGFILVKGQSGDMYQIFRNASHTKVWRSGKLIEEVCVRIKDYGVPKTDNVIAFKTMIEASETEFKKCGNVYKMAKAA